MHTACKLYIFTEIKKIKQLKIKRMSLAVIALCIEFNWHRNDKTLAINKRFSAFYARQKIFAMDLNVFVAIALLLLPLPWQPRLLAKRNIITRKHFFFWFLIFFYAIRMVQLYICLSIYLYLFFLYIKRTPICVLCFLNAIRLCLPTYGNDNVWCLC